MAGLSFLVSPETQQQQAQIAADVQHGLQLSYGAEKQRQQIEEQSRLEDERLRGQQQREAANNSRMFQLQANKEQADAKALENKTFAERVKEKIDAGNKTLASNDASTREWVKQAEGNSAMYVPGEADRFAGALNQANAQTRDMWNQYSDQLTKLKPDDSMPAEFDWSQTPYYQTSFSSENPDRRAMFKQQLQNLGDTDAKIKAQTQALLNHADVQKMDPYAKQALLDYHKAFLNYTDAHAKAKAYDVAYPAANDQSRAKDVVAGIYPNLDAVDAEYRKAAEGIKGYAADAHYGQTVRRQVLQDRQAAGYPGYGFQLPAGLDQNDQSGDQSGPQVGQTGGPDIMTQPIGLGWGIPQLKP